DDIKELFDFKIERGDMTLIVKDPSLEKVGKFAEWKKHAAIFLESPKKIYLERQGRNQAIAYVWEFPDDYYNPTTVVTPVYGKRKKNGKIGAPIKEITAFDLEEINVSPETLQLYQTLTSLETDDYIVDEHSSAVSQIEDDDIDFVLHERAYHVIEGVYEVLSHQGNYLLR